MRAHTVYMGVQPRHSLPALAQPRGPAHRPAHSSVARAVAGSQAAGSKPGVPSLAACAPQRPLHAHAPPPTTTAPAAATTTTARAADHHNHHPGPHACPAQCQHGGRSAVCAPPRGVCVPRQLLMWWWCARLIAWCAAHTDGGVRSEAGRHWRVAMDGAHRAALGIEPRTSCTLSKNHATRPSNHCWSG